MGIKPKKKQQVLRFLIYVGLALVVFYILDSQGIILSFWQQLFFVALPLLFLVDFAFHWFFKRKSS